jgi:hypothetical protein
MPYRAARLFALILSSLLGALLTGCGGGSSPSPVGVWSRASIGQPGQASSALVPCPNSVTLTGTSNVVSCKPGESLWLNADGTFVIDLVKNEIVDSSTTFKLATRTWGTYVLTDGRISCAISARATDFNGNGIFESTETTTPVVGATLSINVRQVSASKMLAEATVDGVTNTALYTR